MLLVQPDIDGLGNDESGFVGVGKLGIEMLGMVKVGACRAVVGVVVWTGSVVGVVVAGGGSSGAAVVAVVG